MPGCCIENCENRNWYYAVSKNIQFHRFPREIAVRQQWLNACQRKESDIKVDEARICSIHFEKNCKIVKEIVRLKEGSIPTKFLNLKKKRKRPMLQNKKDNKKIKVPEKSSIVPTYTKFVQYAQQKQRLSQEETVTRMETDVAQNMEEAGKNMESDILQDTKKKVTKNIDTVAIQNMEEQSEAIKQQVKQGINDNTNYVDVKTLSKQLRKTEKLNQKLLNKNKNLKERNRDLSTQVAQLQAEIKNMTKNKHKEAKTIVIDALHKTTERLSSEDIARAVSSL
ncbi:uncharacterized protein [Temnothorax nylanderi]|uniref:uncharacterized protein n=1 Tax=Temnothorax nylanderi TaxID=102681 RepID=UPI003A8A2C30